MWGVLVAFCLACTPDVAPPEPPPEPAAPEIVEIDRDRMTAQIRRHFESGGQLSADVNLELVALEPSEIGTLQRGRIRLWKDEQEQELEFLVSADGRWFLRVTPVDLTVDPVAQVIESIEIGPDDPRLGADDAKVTIVEYSDFQCPFCAQAEAVVQEQILKEYGDQVRFVYKQMPLVTIHPWSRTASEVGLCILRRDGNEVYWKYHREVFARQQEVQAHTAEMQLLDLAREVGADADGVKACVESDETEPIITATIEEAEQLSINSTPTFFINGHRLSGAQPPEAFKALIEPELGNS